MGRIKAFLRPLFVRGLILVAITSVIAVIYGSAACIGLYGAALQLVAIGVVAADLQGAINLFAPGKLRQDALAWWSWLAGKKNHDATAALGGANGGIGAEASVVRPPLPTSGSDQEQLDALRARIEVLQSLRGGSRFKGQSSGVGGGTGSQVWGHQQAA